MELIPGLTNDLARNCLIRLPYTSLRYILSVCKAWNSDIRSPYFHSLRRLSGYTRPVFLLSQRCSDHSLTTTIANYVIGVFDPYHGTFTKLPLGPELPNQEHVMCSIVGFGSMIVVFVSWDSERELANDNEVHVFDFWTGKWRNGAVMPGPRRILFGVGNDPVNNTVLIAGGINASHPSAMGLFSGGIEGDSTTVMTSALLYDVSRDTWRATGDMENAIILRQVIFQGGRFHVMGGFNRAQETSLTAETLDPDTCQWSPHVEGEFVDSSEYTSHQIMENGEDDVYPLYIRDDGATLAARRGGKWEKVLRISPRLDIVSAAIWRDKMLVLDVEKRGRSEIFWINTMDIKSFEWSTVVLPNCFDFDKSSSILSRGMDL